MNRQGRINFWSGLRAIWLTAVLATVAGCSAGYYLQAAAGQAALIRSRVPLEQVLADPQTSPETRRQLLVADEALLFARLQLGLPASKSYQAYAALDRPAVVWNVFAAPEFSLKPLEWCYPVAGCATYRGWFSERRARQFAGQLAQQGNDVFVGGVAAYSTLGWFADPILSTMLGGSDADLAGILFHELAHQKVFLPGDTRFNEGFATFVQVEGTERWLRARGNAAALCSFQRQQHRRSLALAILSALRQTLATAYAAPDMNTALRRTARQAAFAEARARYAALRSDWFLVDGNGAHDTMRKPKESVRFDGWFDGRLNNARLAALSSYDDEVPAFRALLAHSGGNLTQFYADVAQLASLKPEQRTARLLALKASIAARASVSESAAADSGCRAGY